MKIVVCIKQVPDTNDVKWSKENNIIREGLTNILNPYDEYAIQAALEIKKIDPDTKITLLSMGPNCARETLEYGLALGADNAILLSDKRFSGADTNATSKTLACAIKNIICDFDIIITGQFAIDGDTAQTGPSLSHNLNIPVLTYVKKILDVEETKLDAKCEKEDNVSTIEIQIPCVLCVLKGCSQLKNPKIGDYIKAQNKELRIFNADDIKMDIEMCGIKGSPTFVQKAFRPEITRECKTIEDDYISEILSHIRKNNGKKEETQPEQ